jgi:glycosyltransferase involved in cell wall biosynthesis
MMNSVTTQAKRIPAHSSVQRVLACPAFENRRNNPYNFMLYRGLEELGIQVDEYRAVRGIFRPYDILHVHWPEVPFNAGLLEGLARTRGMLLAIDQLQRRGGKLIWTVHNLRSHERKFPKHEEALWQAFIPKVDGFITLAKSGRDAALQRFPNLAVRPSFVIPHHHYRGEYEDGITREAARAELGVAPNARLVLFFGRVLAYKNVPELVKVVREIPKQHNVQLIVAGRPRTDADARELEAAKAGDPRIRFDLEFIPRERAQVYFRAADLVALPYRDILNSGSAVLALSFDRPVLLPKLGSCVELRARIGDDWVYDYDELTPGAIINGLARAATLPKVTDGHHLADLAVPRIAQETLSAYEHVLKTP